MESKTASKTVSKIECDNDLVFISFAIQKAKTNFYVKERLKSYEQICKDFGIPNIHNPYNFRHKFVNKEYIITDALDMLKESLNYFA